MRSILQESRRILQPVRRGAAAVEFAIVAPVFLLFLAGIIEFGQAFRIEHMLSSASRRGARAAIVTGATNSNVQQKVKTHCQQTLGVVQADTTVLITVKGNSAASLTSAVKGDEISVTVQIPFSKAGAGFFASLFNNKTLSSTTILERE